jgi:hypothetical protein
MKAMYSPCSVPFSLLILSLKGHTNNEIRDFLRVLDSTEPEKTLDGIKILALYAKIFHL